VTGSASILFCFNELGGFFHLHCFLYRGSLGYSPCNYSELRGWRVCSASERETAFSAFPDADAFSFDAWKATLGAVVWSLQFFHDLHVALSHRGSIAGAESPGWSDFLGSASHRVLTNPVFCAVLWPFRLRASRLLRLGRA
jgi:hypothetical protein